MASQNTDPVNKDLPVMGMPKPVKASARVHGIKLVDGDHDIDRRMEGHGAMGLEHLRTEGVKARGSSPVPQNRGATAINLGVLGPLERSTSPSRPCPSPALYRVA